MRIILLILLFTSIISFGKDILNDNQLKLLKDFFELNTFDKAIKYTPVMRFYTDGDEEKIKEAALNATRTALTKLVVNESGEKLSLGAVKKQFEAAFLKEFVNFLFIWQIINKKFQFDIYFLPEIDSAQDYSTEMASNDLLLMNNKGNLKEDLLTLKEHINSKKVRKAIEVIVNKNKDTQKLIGASLSLSLKTLDLNWDPKKPIPESKKNAIKGFIRYRRYFATGDKIEKSINNINVNFNLQKDYKYNLTTIDIYNTFNLGNIKPTPHSIVYNFGVMLDGYGNDISETKIQNQMNSFDEDILGRPPIIKNFGELVFGKDKYLNSHLLVSGTLPEDFKAEISRLVINADSTINSELSIVWGPKGSSLGLFSDKKKKTILEVIGLKLPELLSLSEGRSK